MRKLVKVIQDPISKGFLLLGIMLTLYFIFVLGQLELLIYPIVLLVGALVFRVFVNKGKVEVDETLDPMDRKKILLYYLLALVGIGVGNFLIRGLYDFPLPTSTAIATTTMDAWLFTTLMAIVEEQFFRGEMLEWMANYLPPFMGVLANAAIFTAYHLGVYGAKPDSLLYVMIGGISLAVVTMKSRRLSPAMGAHITNNLLSVLG